MNDPRADRLQESVDGLIVRLDVVSRDLDGVSTRLRRQTRVSWTAIVVGVILAGLLLNAVRDNREDIAANNRFWCPVLSILGADHPEQVTGDGRPVMDELHRLGQRPAYGCW